MQDAKFNHSRVIEGIVDDNASAELLQSAQAGSHPAFEALHKTYSQRLFKQIVAITRHHEDAEDALQETLWKAYVALPLFERRCHVYSWLSRITINCSLMKVRQRRRCREFSVEGQDESDNREAIFEAPDQGWSPEDLCTAEESLREVRAAISSLDPVSQRLLHLRVKEDYSMEEIAKAMNISEPAVKSRLRRARCLLRGLCPAIRCNDVTG